MINLTSSNFKMFVKRQSNLRGKKGNIYEEMKYLYVLKTERPSQQGKHQLSRKIQYVYEKVLNFIIIRIIQ